MVSNRDSQWRYLSVRRGGFESSEIEKAREIGVQSITLGKRILRTETAGLVTLAMLVYNLER